MRLPVMPGRFLGFPIAERWQRAKHLKRDKQDHDHKKAKQPMTKRHIYQL
jgi:hypothetical protein